ncbi:MAG: transposase, partial [Neisseria sp.]|nr:transposase [Neisseria sp.]
MEQTFKQIGKSYAVAAAEIGCSKAALVGVVKHNHWPKKDAAGLREKLKQFFKTNGAVVPD